MAEPPPVVPTTAFEEGRRRGARPRPGDVVRAEAVPEPEPGSGLAGEGSAALAPGAAPGGAAPVPVAELARAFQANAQALEALGSLQSQLIAAVQRNDRAEMMLASTQALNDTFRNLTHVQRAILDRLEEGERARGRGGRLVPLLLLGLAATVVLATFVLVDLGQRFIESQPDPEALTERTAALLSQGREEAAQAAEAEARRAQSALDESDERLRAAQTRLDAERDEHAATQRTLGAKEAELDALRRQASVAQTEALKITSLESEIRDLTSKVAVSEPRLREVQRELDEVRRENARLRRRIAGAELGLPEEAPEPARPSAPLGPEGFPPTAPRAPAATAGSDPAAAPAAPPRPAPRAEPEGTRDAGLISQVRSSLNTLLEAARVGRPDYWQLVRIEAMTTERLKGVVINRYDAQGRLVETIEAAEASLWVERATRRVVLDLRQATRVAGGQRTSLPGGGLTSVVAEGDPQARVFAQSGLRVIGSR